jgi:hypothetical protein
MGLFSLFWEECDIVLWKGETIQNPNAIANGVSRIAPPLTGAREEFVRVAPARVTVEFACGQKAKLDAVYASDGVYAEVLDLLQDMNASAYASVNPVTTPG